LGLSAEIASGEILDLFHPWSNDPAFSLGLVSVGWDHHRHRESLIIMKTLLLLVCMVSFPAFLFAEEVTYSGGKGLKVEEPIVVNAPNEELGVKAEYEYIAKNFPGAKVASQSLSSVGDKPFDVLEMVAKDGKKFTLFFDISSFFGK